MTTLVLVIRLDDHISITFTHLEQRVFTFSYENESVTPKPNNSRSETGAKRLVNVGSYETIKYLAKYNFYPVSFE